MDRVFSVDDMADQFWSPPIRMNDDDNESSTSSSSLKMNRSSSEWAFQRFLQEASAAAAPPVPPPQTAAPAPQSQTGYDQGTSSGQPVSVAAAPQPNIPADPEEYQAFLKSQLDLACAAFALTRGNLTKPKAQPDSGSLEPSAAQPGSQLLSKGAGADPPLKVQDKEVGGPVGIPSLPAAKKLSIPVRSTTSGSSREESDDDDAEGDMEATDNMDPVDAKRMRRMLSNRESARRSRRRKQAHLTELETQVSQLRVENSSLVKRLTDVSHKYSEAAVDNRVLKADVETLRAKVKMAEETVKRVTGLSPLFQAMSEVSPIGLPSFTASPSSDTSADAAVPVQDNPKPYYQAPVPNHLPQSTNHLPQSINHLPPSTNHLPPSTNHLPPTNHLPVHNPRMQNGMASADNNLHNNPIAATGAVAGNNKIGRTSSMQRVASLEHLQKRIRGEASSLGNEEPHHHQLHMDK